MRHVSHTFASAAKRWTFHFITRMLAHFRERTVLSRERTDDRSRTGQLIEVELIERRSIAFRRVSFASRDTNNFLDTEMENGIREERTKDVDMKL